MLLKRVVLLLFLLTPLFAMEPSFKQKCLQHHGVEHALVRSYPSLNKHLLLNTQSLESSLLCTTELPKLSSCRKGSSYQNLRKAVLNEPKRIANRGLKTGYKDAYVLTVDMCPSSKNGFELDFFKTLIAKQEAFPVTISITQNWALRHRSEFELLKAWDDAKKLDITWMNHGARHPYKRDVTLEKNFINLKSVVFKDEVLHNETFLIKEGRVPSVFYRFAGLVSNDQAFNYLVKELGLIPVGSSAWLAKGEKIQNRSLVLVHGNRNEPLGIRRLLQSHSTLPVIGLPEMFVTKVKNREVEFIFLKKPLLDQLR
jgi:hypothetical protein